MTDAISILEATHFDWGLQYKQRVDAKLGDKFIDNNNNLITVVPGCCVFCPFAGRWCIGVNKPFTCGGSIMLGLG